jgi:ribosomal protein L37AE/L43A
MKTLIFRCPYCSLEFVKRAGDEKGEWVTCRCCDGEFCLDCYTEHAGANNSKGE